MKITLKSIYKNVVLYGVYKNETMFDVSENNLCILKMQINTKELLAALQAIDKSQKE